MKLKHNCIHIALMVYTVSCTNGSEKLSVSSLAFETRTIELPSERYLKYIQKDLEVIGLVEGYCVDSFFLFRSLDSLNTFKVYSSNTLNYCGSLFQYGQGPEDYLNLGTQGQYIVENGEIKLWTQDTSTRKIRLTNITRSLSNHTIVKELEFKHHESFYNCLLVNDSTFIGDTYDGDNMYCKIYNPLKNEFTPLFHFFEQKEENVTITGCASTLKPDKSRFAYVMMHYNQIIISSIDGANKFSIAINTPLLVEKIKNKKETEWIDFSTSIISTDSQIWILYQNATFENQTNGTYHTSKILVFDWEGNPLYQFNTDKNLWTIFFNKDKSILYGIGKDEQIYNYAIADYIL